jgi:hypothetical protein
MGNLFHEENLDGYRIADFCVVRERENVEQNIRLKKLEKGDREVARL